MNCDVYLRALKEKELLLWEQLKLTEMVLLDRLQCLLPCEENQT